MGDDSVDFWSEISCSSGMKICPIELIDIPVRMFWKASSTLLASSAEVSIKERLFSPAAYHQHQSTEISRQHRVSHTCKLLGLLCWHSPQMPQITLVSYQHDDNVRVRVVPQLLQPPGHILVRLVLADIVDEQGADCPSIVG